LFPTVEPAASQHGHDRLDFVQALRGIAALAVVMFHLRPAIDGPAYLDLGDRLFINGAAGVDLFFVISGFIMVHVTRGAGGTWRDAAGFLLKRLARIWPVYVVLTIAFLVATIGLHHALGIRHDPASLARAFAFVPQSPRFPPFFGYEPLGVGWTLNYEAWFYVLFALAMLAGRKRWVVLAAAFAVATFGVQLISNGHIATTAYESVRGARLIRMLANPLMLDFALGIAVGLVYQSRARLANPHLRATFVALAVLAVICQLGSSLHAGHGAFGWGFAMAVMMLALAIAHKAQPLRPPRALVQLGDVSFSLYLVHPLVIEIMRAHAPVELAGGFPYVMVCATLSIVLAGWSFRWLERGLAERMRGALMRLVAHRT
jgi:exopolysaccharide production protein ExoZ